MSKFISLLSCFLFLSITAFSQSRSQLEDERNRLIEKIEQTSNKLNQTSSSKKATLEDLKAIENQIDSRKELIENINAQLKSADAAISNNKDKIDSLETNLKNIQEQYYKLAQKIYVRHLSNNTWAYLFSSSSLNEAFLRWRYSKQFESYVEQKIQQINKITNAIASRNTSIEEEKEYVSKLLKEEKKNYNQLEKDLKKKDDILAQLKKEEASLTKALDTQKKQREKLNAEIERIILAELSKKKTNNSTSVGIVKNKVTWPGKGYISGKFGKQAHPTLRNVTINNNGIDITAPKPGSPVSSVAEGVVIGVTQIPNYDNMVIIQHGKYYSVYSRLLHVIVKKDDQVFAGQTIGRLNNDPQPILHFELWEGKNKLNPEKWLKPN